MKGINIRNIVTVCGGTYYGPEKPLDQEADSICTDSRKIEQNSLFIPIRGTQVDGHSFIEQAFEKGALFTLSEEKLDGRHPYVLVESTLQALKDIAEFYRRESGVLVVGVTGSVGKTSTKEMIASVLEQRFCTLKTPGNFNNEIGLPLTVFQLREEHQVAVLEMGISDFGEMSRLTKVARPDIAVITNIGLCHLEQLKSRDGVLQAKSEIFEGLSRDGTIILNGEDDKLCTIEEYNGIRPVFFGFDKEHEIYADHIENRGLKGVSCVIHTQKGAFCADIAVPGIHMVQNAMAACGVGLAMGMEPEQIRQGIEALKSVGGRSHIIYGASYTILDDCYNANPVSMKASVDILATTPGRKVCILGDMFELGEEERQLHEQVGGYIAQKDVDLLITVGELSRYILKGAQESKTCRCVHFPDKEAAMQALPGLLLEGDSILVKASHGMEFSEIVQFLDQLQG